MRILFLAAIILFPALASAQSIEVFAMTGAVQLWDDEGNIGVGVPIGGGVGFKSPHGWGFELSGRDPEGEAQLRQRCALRLDGDRRRARESSNISAADALSHTPAAVSA